MASHEFEPTPELEEIIKESPLKPKSRYVQCPYHSAHYILLERFQNHLGRCRKNFSNVPKVTCPFNVTHVLNEPEMEWHLQNCPGRLSYEIMSNAKPADKKTEIPEFNPVDTNPSWDDEPLVETYNPENYCATAPVYRTLQGVAPSIKKQFRYNEIKRLVTVKGDLNDNSNLKETSSDASDSP